MKYRVLTTIKDLLRDDYEYINDTADQYLEEFTLETMSGDILYIPEKAEIFIMKLSDEIQTLKEIDIEIFIEFLEAHNETLLLREKYNISRRRYVRLETREDLSSEEERLLPYKVEKRKKRCAYEKEFSKYSKFKEDNISYFLMNYNVKEIRGREWLSPLIEQYKRAIFDIGNIEKSLVNAREIELVI